MRNNENYIYVHFSSDPILLVIVAISVPKSHLKTQTVLGTKAHSN